MANTLINVEVFKAGVEGKFGAKRKLTQFVETEVSNDIQVGKFNLVTNEYVGDATVVGKGVAIPLSDLKQAKQEVVFEKIAKGVAVTDEEKGQTFGDPVGNAENQTVMAIENKMDAKVADLLKTATFTVEATALDADAIIDAVGAMGENIEDAPYYLIVSTLDYADLQKALLQTGTDLNNNPFGATVVMSGRLAKGEAYLVQEGAIKEFVQKDTDVEVSRNAGKKQDEIYTDKIHAVYIQDQSKIVKFVIGAGE